MYQFFVNYYELLKGSNLCCTGQVLYPSIILKESN